MKTVNDRKSMNCIVQDLGLREGKSAKAIDEFGAYERKRGVHIQRIYSYNRGVKIELFVCWLRYNTSTTMYVRMCVCMSVYMFVHTYQS